MKKLTAIFFSIVSYFVLSCSPSNSIEELNENSDYDILISYNHYKTDTRIKSESMNQRYLRNGKLYLTFESGFNNDSIIVDLNNDFYKSDKITTEGSTGVAKQYVFDNIKDVNSIGIRVNGGKKALIEVDTMNFILVTFHDSQLKVEIPKNAPYYD